MILGQRGAGLAGARPSDFAPSAEGAIGFLRGHVRPGGLGSWPGAPLRHVVSRQQSSPGGRVGAGGQRVDLPGGAAAGGHPAGNLAQRQAAVASMATAHAMLAAAAAIGLSAHLDRADELAWRDAAASRT